MNTHLVHPTVWQPIVDRYTSHYGSKFSPRMILPHPDGRYLWQANQKTQIDISNWLLPWKKDGKEYLETIKDWCEMDV